VKTSSAERALGRWWWVVALIHLCHGIW